MARIRLTTAFIAIVISAFMSNAVHAIYTDDHWDYSVKLTEDNFEKTIQAEIDAGKTMFVRWIASSG